MHLYLIRHAESENNARPSEERVEDPALTAVGQRQASALGDWIAQLRPDHLVTSPFRRALQTLRPAADQLCPSDRMGTSPTVQVWDDVYERGGCFSGWNPTNTRGRPGLSHDGIRQHLPQAKIVDDLDPQGWWQQKDRETDDACQQRARRVKGRLESTLAHSPGRWAVISHADFLRCLLGHLISDQGIDAQALGPIYNAGVTHLLWHGDRWELHWFNSVSHLPSSLASDPTSQLLI